MHLRLEDLLALRDGEGAEDAARHVESCAECAGRLEELREMRDLLKALPDPKPGRDLWPALRKAAEARRRRRWATGVAAAAAVVLLLATAVLLWTPRSRNSSAPAIKALANNLGKGTCNPRPHSKGDEPKATASVWLIQSRPSAFALQSAQRQSIAASPPSQIAHHLENPLQPVPISVLRHRPLGRGVSNSLHFSREPLGSFDVVQQFLKPRKG